MEPTPATPGPAGRRPSGPGRWTWVVVAGAVAFYAVFVWRSSFLAGGERCFSLFDDSMISMRYARNLADGHGLRWNAGEAPVEGYTNFLWTLLMAALHLLPVSPERVSLLVMLAGAAVLLVNLRVVASLARHVSGSASTAVPTSVGLVAFCYPLVFWTLRGTETSLLCLLTDVAMLLAFRLVDRYSRADLVWLGLALAAGILTRPDAIVPAAVIGAFVLRAAWRAGSRAPCAVLPLALGAVVAGHTLFRLSYYGDPLPNTYYLKLTGVSLLERLSRGAGALAEVAAYHLWPVLLVLLAALPSWRRRPGGPKLRLLLAVFAGQCAYSVAVGGDAWEETGFANRYLTIALPGLLVVVAHALPALHPRAWRWVVPALGAGLVLHGVRYLVVKPERLAVSGLVLTGLAIGVAGSGVLVLDRRGRLRPGVVPVGVACLAGLASNAFGIGSWLVRRNSGGMIAEDGEASRRGLLLRRVTTPDATIAHVWAGAEAYFSGRRAVDLLGKCDPVIARSRPVGPFVPGHDRWSLAHSIGVLKPDLVTSLWSRTPADEDAMARFGYVKLENGSYLLAGSGRVDRAAWERGLP